MEQTRMEKFSYWADVGCDLVLLNLLWLLGCLPIVTIGASTTAMHYVVRKMAVGEPYTVWGSFWSSFRTNWKQATVLLLVMTALIGVFAADFYIGTQTQGALDTACQVIGVLGLVIAACIVTMAFPLLARYTQRVPEVLKSALLLGLTNPHIPLAGWAAALVFPALVLLNDHLIIIAPPAWLLIGTTLAALVIQLLLRPVYAKLETSIPREEENNGNSETEAHL